MVKKISLVFATLLFGVLLVSFSSALTNVSECGTLNVAGEYYILNESFSTTTGTCLTIDADNITLDGDGYNITGDWGSTIGINSSSGTNLTLKNMYIRNFGEGLSLSNFHNSSFTDVIIWSMIDSAVRMWNSHDNVFDNITIEGVGSGFEIVENSSRNNYTEISIDYCGIYGINLSTSFATDNHFNKGHIKNCAYGVKSNSLLTIQDFNLSNTNTEIHAYEGGTINVINVTYDIDEEIAEDSFIYRKWYFNAQVNYTHNGTAVNNANISSWNITSYQSAPTVWNEGGGIDTDCFRADLDYNGIANNPDWNIASAMGYNQSFLDFIRELSLITPERCNFYNTGFEKFSALTGTDGKIEPQQVTEYVNNGSRIYTSNNTMMGRLSPEWTTDFYVLNISGNMFQQFFLDDGPAPIITIENPKSQVYDINTNFNLNFTSFDYGSGLDTCFYSLDGAANVTLACGTNTTVGLADGEHTLIYYANDSVNHLSSTSTTFVINTVGPAIVLNYPPEGWNRSYSYFNYTASDSDGISSCSIYHNFNGQEWHLNHTNAGITSGQQNFTTYTLFVEGEYKWNVWCNDTYNNGAWAIDNQTIGYDNSTPNVYIDSLTQTGSSIGTFAGSHDDVSCTDAFYSVYNSSGDIEGVYENASTTCGSPQGAFIVQGFGEYTLRLYIKDAVGYENYTDKNITIGELPSGGGGGGGGQISKLIPVVALEKIQNAKEYNDLDRAIIYAFINNYISVQVSGTQVATENLVDYAHLSLEDLKIIKENLATADLTITLDDLEKYYNGYLNKELEQVYATQDQIDKYGLLPSLVGILTNLQITPNRVDKMVWIFEPEGSIKARPQAKSQRPMSMWEIGPPPTEFYIPLTFVSNKPLKSCEVISDTTNLICWIEDSKIKVEFHINDTVFFSRIFSGSISVITEAENSDMSEQSIIPITLRVYNTAHKKAAIIGGVGLISLIGLFFIVKDKRGKRYKYEDFKKAIR